MAVRLNLRRIRRCSSSVAIRTGCAQNQHGLATILGAGESPVAVIASVLVLSEQVTAPQWIGVIVILLGIAYPQIAAQKRGGCQRYKDRWRADIKRHDAGIG